MDSIKYDFNSCEHYNKSLYDYFYTDVPNWIRISGSKDPVDRSNYVDNIDRYYTVRSPKGEIIDILFHDLANMIGCKKASLRTAFYTSGVYLGWELIEKPEHEKPVRGVTFDLIFPDGRKETCNTMKEGAQIIGCSPSNFSKILRRGGSVVMGVKVKVND